MVKKKEPMGDHLPGASYKHANVGSKTSTEITGTSVFWILTHSVLKPFIFYVVPQWLYLANMHSDCSNL